MLREFSLLMILVAIRTTLSSSASSEDVSIDLGSDGLFKMPLTETSDSTETKKSLKEYYRWLSKKEQNLYLDKHRQEMSQEEKNQVKFYENLLQHVKNLSKKMSGRRKIKQDFGGRE